MEMRMSKTENNPQNVQQFDYGTTESFLRKYDTVRGAYLHVCVAECTRPTAVMTFNSIKLESFQAIFVCHSISFHQAHNYLI